ncbi:MAG: hypothetical protein PWQ28_194 [Candidatus Woesearchaeota archaeon]|nr:hypothetical protein [Candidatus Woesearchaeota archaeon]MDK2908188.1 hypothetical protein [Candidatus Woesearchaeota archaeon]
MSKNGANLAQLLHVFYIKGKAKLKYLTRKSLIQIFFQITIMH